MLNVKEAYKAWSEQYDTNVNKTRDAEAISLRETLKDMQFDSCLEIGCGTGKNTEWLKGICKSILAIDISEEMLSVARKKINEKHVRFLNADINQSQNFAIEKFDLVVCSLVLEHIENIHDIIHKISELLKDGGLLYIGELHPFKQYTGSKPKFETEMGEQVVSCFIHHISEFTDAANKAGLKIEEIKEYFDDNDKSNLPRILTMLLRK